MITEGQLPKGLPEPIKSNNIFGRKYVSARGRHYVIDVRPFPTDGELCWTAYRWNGRSWPKIPMWTGSEERRFPKTIAKIASDFTDKLKTIQAGV